MCSVLVSFILFKERQQILFLIPTSQSLPLQLQYTIINNQPSGNCSYKEVYRIHKQYLSPNTVIKPPRVRWMPEHRVDTIGDYLMSTNLFFPYDICEVRSQFDFSSETKQETSRRNHKSKPEYSGLVLMSKVKDSSDSYNPNQLCSIQNSITPKIVQIIYCQL